MARCRPTQWGAVQEGEGVVSLTSEASGEGAVSGGPGVMMYRVGCHLHCCVRCKERIGRGGEGVL